MNCAGDNSPDMTTNHGDLDEQAIDALLGARGGAVPAEFQDVAVLVTQLRGIIDAPAVQASPALAAMLAHGLPAAGPEPRAWITSTRPAAWRRARRSALAVGISALVGISAVGVAAAQDRLPNWAQDMAETLIEATTPFEFPDRSRTADHADQEPRPSLTDRSDPRPGPADLQETTGGPDRDVRTDPAAPGPQPLDAQWTDEDDSPATSDPTTVDLQESAGGPDRDVGTDPAAPGPQPLDAQRTDEDDSPASSDPTGAPAPTAISPAPPVRQPEAPATRRPR